MKSNTKESLERIANRESISLIVSRLPVAAQDPEKEIKFSNNWNGKLYCHYFTSIRLQSSYWKKYDYYKVMHDGVFSFRAQVIDKTEILLSQLKPYAAFLDTGYSLDETKNLLTKMYPGKNWEKQKLDLILFKNLEY
jgi:hypothetical protein